MTRAEISRRSAALSHRTAAVVLLAVAISAFAIGRRTASPDAPAGACPEPLASGAPTPLPGPALPTFSANAAPSESAAPAPARPPPSSRGSSRSTPPRLATARAPVTSEAIGRATDEVKAKLERMRRYITSSCLRPQEAAGSVKLTYNLAFDAAGREIARVVNEEHRGPPGALGKCLRTLPGTALFISPPGATVAVTVAANYP
jgi:hypothetical protein